MRRSTPDCLFRCDSHAEGSADRSWCSLLGSAGGAVGRRKARTQSSGMRAVLATTLRQSASECRSRTPGSITRWRRRRRLRRRRATAPMTAAWPLANSSGPKKRPGRPHCSATGPAPRGTPRCWSARATPPRLPRIARERHDAESSAALMAACAIERGRRILRVDVCTLAPTLQGVPLSAAWPWSCAARSRWRPRVAPRTSIGSIRRTAPEDPARMAAHATTATTTPTKRCSSPTSIAEATAARATSVPAAGSTTTARASIAPTTCVATRPARGPTTPATSPAAKVTAGTKTGSRVLLARGIAPSRKALRSVDRFGDERTTRGQQAAERQPHVPMVRGAVVRDNDRSWRAPRSRRGRAPAR